MMRYNTDGSGYIANYAIVGDLADGQTYAGELPADFAQHARAYRVLDGALTLDAARAAALDVEATAEDTPADPIADLAELVLDNTLDIELLKLGFE